MTPATALETWSVDGLPVVRQAAWLARFPGLVQGVTGREPGLDFSQAGTRTSAPGERAPWDQLRAWATIERVVRCRQVHGAGVVVCEEEGEPGVWPLGPADALVTRRPNLLLAVTVADCVPVFLVDPERRVLGLAHAGWRGTAAGVVEATLAALGGLGSRAASLYVHLGPAICGRCYEVGPEVTAALGEAQGARRLDLRAHLAQRALRAGVDPGRLTGSTLCTRCDGERFFSYRGGDRAPRMCAFLGWRAG